MQKQNSGSISIITNVDLAAIQPPYICNIVPSPSDVRDWPSECIVRGDFKVPPKFHVRYAMPPIENQGSEYNLSAAYAATSIKEWQEYHNVGIVGTMSAFFLYNNRFNSEKTSMYGREIMHILKHHGSCRLETYSVQRSEPIQEIEPYAYDEANNFRITAYARVYTIDSLKLCLLKNGPCLITMPVFNYSETPWKSRGSERQIGGTAMVATGYDVRGFQLRNSWGIEWGDKGHCTYPYEHWGTHFEIWTLLDDTSSRSVYACQKKHKSISRWIWKRAMELQKNAGDLFINRKRQEPLSELSAVRENVTHTDVDVDTVDTVDTVKN